MKWIDLYAKEFEKDELRRLISEVNWSYHKSYIKVMLDTFAKKLSINGIDAYAYNYSDSDLGERTSFGFDGMSLQLSRKITGNARVIKDSYPSNHKENEIHFQYGANLAITYSAVGHVYIWIFPSKSEDSLAKHEGIILYHTYDARTITRKVIEKSIRSLIHYHRYTGVLHRSTWKDKLIIKWLKFKMYLMQYLNPNERFERYSGIYIPTLSLVVALVAAIASVAALLVTLKNG